MPTSGTAICRSLAPALAGLVLALVLALPAAAEKIRGSHAGLPQCGDRVIAARACPTCEATPAFELDGYWHKLAQCARDIRDLWRSAGPLAATDLPGRPAVADLARAAILQEVTRPRVVFRAGAQRLSFAEVFGPDLELLQPFSEMLLTNDLGQPYNGMGQSGLALYLYHLAARAEAGGYGRAAADAAFYRRLARGAVAPLLSPVEDGGLASIGSCAQARGALCIWFHSVTRRDRPAAAGGTLNQMLHVVRDLQAMAQLARTQGWEEPVDFEIAAEAGLNQLFLADPFSGPGSAPNLDDFISDLRGPNGAPWAWYGHDLGPGGRAYFLKNPEKNCSYHLHVLALLRATLIRAEKDGRAGAALERAFAPGSALRLFMKAARDADRGRIGPRLTCTAPKAAKSVKTLRQLSKLRERVAG